ncbi:MAG: prenyltransferase [Thiotrichales bacterium]|nr:prenyltransferase [Thiotrichales bacterium]
MNASRSTQSKRFLSGLPWAILRASRPRFLVLALVLPLCAAALSYSLGQIPSASDFLLVSVSALLAHAAVNLHNEIEDTESGLDRLTQRTAFSGGSGALFPFEKNLQPVRFVFYSQLILLVFIGTYLAWSVSWWILLMGVVGLGLIRFYTSYCTRHSTLYWLAAGLGFGPILFLGSFWVFYGSITLSAFLVAAVVFLWVNNLLLVNQLPDLTADAQVGRRNLWMTQGVVFGWRLFVASALLSVLLLIALSGVLQKPLLSLSALVLIPAGWIAWRLALYFRQPKTINLAPILALNVIINVILPLLLALLLSWSSFDLFDKGI